MKLSPVRILRALTRPISRRSPVRRDDSGLTTLEWLLIVAAVAGLAALAVVLVQRVVSDTAEQISGSSARKIAARVAAQEVTDEARAEDATSDNDANDDMSAVSLNAEYKSDCKLIGITYGDVPDLTVIWHNDIEDAAKPTVDANVTTEAIWDADEQGCYIP